MIDFESVRKYPLWNFNCSIAKIKFSFIDMCLWVILWETFFFFNPCHVSFLKDTSMTTVIFNVMLIKNNASDECRLTQGSYSLSMIKFKHLTQSLSTFPKISEMKILTLQNTILLVCIIYKTQEKKNIFHFHLFSGKCHT